MREEGEDVRMMQCCSVNKRMATENCCGVEPGVRPSQALINCARILLKETSGLLILQMAGRLCLETTTGENSPRRMASNLGGRILNLIGYLHSVHCCFDIMHAHHMSALQNGRHNRSQGPIQPFFWRSVLDFARQRTSDERFA